jgi:hypothetical protein
LNPLSAIRPSSSAIGGHVAPFFNLGRDITLITLYPFLFGYIMLTIWAQVHGEK